MYRRIERHEGGREEGGRGKGARWDKSEEK